jgi:serine protease Do
VARDGRRITMPVRLTERPRPRSEDGDDQVLPGNRGPRPATNTPEMPLGITVREMDRSFSGRLEIPDAVQGVVVTRVDPTGAAFSAQVRRGFVILEINRRPVRSVADYQRIVAAAQPGDVLALLYYDPTLGQRAVLTVTVE